MNTQSVTDKRTYSCALRGGNNKDTQVIIPTKSDPVSKTLCDTAVVGNPETMEIAINKEASKSDEKINKLTSDIMKLKASLMFYKRNNKNLKEKLNECQSLILKLESDLSAEEATTRHLTDIIMSLRNESK